jgi:hypothetical protein
MKSTTLLCLCACIVLFTACDGPESGETGQTANQPGEASSMSFDNLTEAREYLTAHYSEEQMREMFVEFAALSKADNEFYYEKDEAGNYIDQGEEAENEIIGKMNENIDAVIKSFGINRPLFAALMSHSATTDWGLELQDQIEARATEINAGRTE